MKHFPSSVALLTVLGAFAFGCDSEEQSNALPSADATVVETPDSEPAQETKGIIQALVSDGEGQPLEGVTAKVGDQTYTTDAQGMFQFQGEPGEYVIKLSKAGYTDAALTATIQSRVTALVREGLWKRSAPVSLDSAVGGVAGTTHRVHVSPGHFVHADGSAVTGEIKAFVTPYDITSDLELAPGTFAARRADNSTTNLETLGMADFHFEDADGNVLKVADGQKVPVEIVVTDAEVGEHIPAWSFDLETGLWVEEGEGVVSLAENGDKVWRAEFTHFSPKNVDRPVLVTHCVYGVIWDCAERGVGGARVTATSGGAQFVTNADQDGMYCVSAVSGSQVQIDVVGNMTGGITRGTTTANVPGGESNCGNSNCIQQDLTVPCP